MFIQLQLPTSHKLPVSSSPPSATLNRTHLSSTFACQLHGRSWFVLPQFQPQTGPIFQISHKLLVCFLSPSCKLDPSFIHIWLPCKILVYSPSPSATSEETTKTKKQERWAHSKLLHMHSGCMLYRLAHFGQLKDCLFDT